MAEGGEQRKYINPSSSIKIGSLLGRWRLYFGDNGHMFYATSQIKHSEAIVKVLDRKKPRGIDLKEISTSLASLRHPHIMELHQSIVSPRHIIDIFEYPSEETLHTYRVKVDICEYETKRFFQQIISAVDYCHRNLIIHRDVTLDNFLLDNFHNVKLKSFTNSAVKSDGSILRKFLTTEEYRAPELYSQESYVGPELDIWSCGVCLMLLHIKGISEDVNERLDLHPAVFDRQKWKPLFSPSLRELMKLIFQVKPENRATMKDIKNHPWFKENLPAYLEPMAMGYHSDRINLRALEEVHKKCQVPVREVYETVLKSHPSDKLCFEYNLTMDNWRSTQSQTLWSEERSRGGKLPFQRFAALNKENASALHDELRFYRGFYFDKPGTNHSLMGVVYSALKKLNFEWQIMNHHHHHHLIVRRRGASENTQVRIALQIYFTYFPRRPYIICMESLPQSDGTSESSAGAHKVMIFLEECSRIYHQLTKEMETYTSNLPWLRGMSVHFTTLKIFHDMID